MAEKSRSSNIRFGRDCAGSIAGVLAALAFYLKTFALICRLSPILAIGFRGIKGETNFMV